MELGVLLDRLGYSDSPHFLRRGSSAFAQAPDFGHIFRKADNYKCGLKGVYTLRRDPESLSDPVVPVVYVCEAKSDNDAREIHRLVWNQDVTPFVMVYSPGGVRLYSGFRYNHSDNGQESGVLQTLRSFNDISDIIEGFSSEAIDSGRVWRDWGQKVQTDRRVDWHLLDGLKRLDTYLRTKANLSKEVSHALIGKYVYFRYLEDRGILSARKLEAWGLSRDVIFGRHATLAGLMTVSEKLDDWLNGQIFPLNYRALRELSDDVVCRVARAFNGDEYIGAGQWQLALDFKVYDFSYIPIETLSVIYEQFLHIEDKNGKKTKGEEAAAYYTPIPVVNFILNELDERLPLKRGLKVFDPACGSGAFLVQCFRRLIERTFPRPGAAPKPAQLRGLLESSIFGMDNDPDACSVTELSLTLTLLDYVDPPDLEVKGKKPHLPSLRHSNIFHANFFKWPAAVKKVLAKNTFDWVVGNPPWKRININKVIDQDKPVLAWMHKQKASRPCDNRDVAQAFAWKAVDLVRDDGLIALLLPAKILLAETNDNFRRAFFTKFHIECVANLANLRHSLFGRGARPVAPSAAVFYGKQGESVDESIPVFSPLSLNQEGAASRHSSGGNSSWNLLVNLAEIKDVPTAAASSGSGLAWKIAAWGSPFDIRLLNSIGRRFTKLGELEGKGQIVIAEGPALQKKETEAGEHRTRKEDVAAGKRTIKFDELQYSRPLFAFPEMAKVPNEKIHLDLRGSVRGMEVCRGPHIIVSGTGKFACFDREYLVIPRRWFGIVSTSDDESFLRALSLYLNSDFVFYNLFLTSAELGVERDRIAISKLRQLPVPLDRLSKANLRRWAAMQRELERMEPSQFARPSRSAAKQMTLFDHLTEALPDGPRLLAEMNNEVYSALELDDGERALVHDLVHVRLQANDGRLGEEATRRPQNFEINEYVAALQAELNAFVGDDSGVNYQVWAAHDAELAMVSVELSDGRAMRGPAVRRAAAAYARELERARQHLRKEAAQWVYYDRALRIFEGPRTFLFKPMQRIHWTVSQAMIDASDLIADTLECGTARHD